MTNLGPVQAFHTLAGGATFSRKTANEDAFAVGQRQARSVTGVAVADGIGSHFGAGLSAERACIAFRRAVEEPIAGEPANLAHVFERVRRSLFVDPLELPEGSTAENSYGTTLLCAMETPGRLDLGYVGNGSIWHVRGDFDTFPASRPLPWSAINYLNPHSRSVEGKNLLYKWLSPWATGAQARPTLLSVGRDDDLFGDIIVLCSDGIYSYDQTDVGSDSSGRLWVSGEETIRLLYPELAAFFSGGAYTDEALEAALQRYLVTLGQRDLVNDDCTVAVIITPAAQRYHAVRHLNERTEPVAEVSA